MFSFESILYTFNSDLQFKHFSVLLVFKHTNHVTYFSQYLPYSPKRARVPISCVKVPLYSVCLLLTFNKSIQSIISLRIWFDKYCFIYFFEFAWSFQNFLLWHNIVAIGGWRHEIFSDILYPCIVACVV